jgi:hypothetical protein
MASRKRRSKKRPIGPRPRLVFIDIVERRAGIEAGSDTRRHAFGKPAAEADRGAAEGPIESLRRKWREGRREAVRFVTRIAEEIGLFPVDQRWRGRELPGKESADEVEGDRPVLFTKRVVAEASEHMAFLAMAAEIDEEFMLRPLMHDAVVARDEEESRHRDRAGIGDDAVAPVEEIGQQAGADLPRDQEIALIGRDTIFILRELARRHIGIDDERPLQLLPERDALPCEGHIELHRKSRRGEHGGADPRRIIMQPAGGNDRADRLGDDGDVRRCETVLPPYLVNESIEVAN